MLTHESNFSYTPNLVHLLCNHNFSTRNKELKSKFRKAPRPTSIKYEIVGPLE